MCPEARDGYEHLEAVFRQVILVAGMPDIVIDGICYCPVAVYLFKGYLPLVMALLTVHGDHRVKGSPCGESQFAGVLNGLAEVFVPVKQQVAGHVRICCTQVEGESKCLCVPVCTAAILLPCESLGTDVKAGILAGIGLVKLEDIETYTLLCGYVTQYDYITMFPFLFPGPTVVCEHGLKTFLRCLAGGGHCFFCQAFRGMVE